MDRLIAHANKVVKLYSGFETPTTIVFYGTQRNSNINIFQKHRDLFAELKKIDENASFKDNTGKNYTNVEDLPTGVDYSEAF